MAPEELTPRERLIAAAMARGIPQSRIAAALGVTCSTVHGLMRRAESKLGRKLKHQYPQRNVGGPRKFTRESTCEHCGGRYVWRWSTRARGIFCSKICSVAASTLIDPVRAIEARKAGQTWKGISISHGCNAHGA